jgi:hypothetical protein
VPQQVRFALLCSIEGILGIKGANATCTYNKTLNGYGKIRKNVATLAEPAAVESVRDGNEAEPRAQRDGVGRAGGEDEDAGGRRGR